MTWNIVTLPVVPADAFGVPEARRSNLKMIKLKRFSSKISTISGSSPTPKAAAFNDATIEMDLWSGKAGGLSTSLRESFPRSKTGSRGSTSKSQASRRSRTTSKIVSQAAREVNKQIEFIAASRAVSATWQKDRYARRGLARGSNGELAYHSGFQ